MSGFEGERAKVRAVRRTVSENDEKEGLPHGDATT